MGENAPLTKSSVLSLESPLARVVEVHAEIGSTQERARELAMNGSPHGSLVVSFVQLGGRGRRGRTWGSPAGGLWMSAVLRLGIEARFAPRVTQTAAVGVAKAIRDFGVPAEIKWPNDLLVGGRKICGVLAESSLDADGSLGFVVLGVGLNANLDAADLGAPGDRATTLRRELGRDEPMISILSTILTRLEVELRRIERFDEVLSDWRSMNCTLGERVRVARLGETLEGEAVDVSSEGALLLRPDHGGEIVELFEGEIENLRPRPPHSPRT